MQVFLAKLPDNLIPISFPLSLSLSGLNQLTHPKQANQGRLKSCSTPYLNLGLMRCPFI